MGRLTPAELEEIGRTDSVMAEIPEILYLLDRPNILDASQAAETLKVTPTPIDLVLEEMAVER
ncbi:hypothetical protein [Actinoallomurus acaciae]|uniref:Uncharacterized protein n=1 Tax=Actinoallomurus acaciae TaxID=502577 RepID=A0ABV5YGG9_9ACTN